MVDSKVLNLAVNSSKITKNRTENLKILNSILEPSDKVRALVA